MSAPSFSLVDQDGTQRTLASCKGAPVVLYFYPKDDTPTCTDQACAFNDAISDLAKLSANVMGISPDDQKSHAKFAAKFKLAFPILADGPGPDGVPPVCAAFGVWQEKSMYGRSYMGVARTTFLIDAEGKIARRWDKVKVKGHIDEVTAALRELAGDGSPVAAGRPARAQAPKKPATRSTKRPAKKSAKKASKKAAKKAVRRSAKKSR
jgi:peroxiredoxin Q/BCP